MEGGRLMSSSASRNKWLKYGFLKKSEQLTPYLPESRIMTQNAFSDLIAKYTHVIVKPIRGSRGKGVIQVSSIENNMYILHIENIRYTIQGKEDTYMYLKTIIGTSEYMVQRRISRPTINDCPFDLRVIVQRKKLSNLWIVTGRVAKVAGKGYIVSNISRSKGYLLPVRTAFQHSTIKYLSTQTLLSNIDRIALLSAERLATHFTGHRIYGLDIGLDQNGRVWIIEANNFPILSHFRKLNDTTMYNRIMAYKKG
jgi:glutathione synthase/RimK-type ligase-like ATP-grasp enzyme